MKFSSKSAAVLILVGVLLVLTVGTAWVLGVGPFGTSDQGPVIATVDGQPIYLGEAQTRAASLAGVHAEGAGPLSSEEWPDQILESLVDDRLIQAEAEQRDIAVSDQELAASVQEVVGMFPDLADYQAWLESEGMDQDEVERRLEQQLLSAAIYDAVTADISVSDEQIRAYYEANLPSYAGVPFKEAKGDIEAELGVQAKDAEFAAWLETRRQQADVVMVMTDWWKEVR
jgi:hypothetical protein